MNFDTESYKELEEAFESKLKDSIKEIYSLIDKFGFDITYHWFTKEYSDIINKKLSVDSSEGEILIRLIDTVFRLEHAGISCRNMSFKEFNIAMDKVPGLMVFL